MKSVPKTEFRPKRAFKVLLQIWHSPLKQVSEWEIIGQPDGAFHLGVLKRFNYVGTLLGWVKITEDGRKALERIANAGLDAIAEPTGRAPHFDPKWTSWYG